MLADARLCEVEFLPVLKKLSTISNYTMHYIGKVDEEGQVTCMHGESECTGNKQQLCIQKHYPGRPISASVAVCGGAL